MTNSYIHANKKYELNNVFLYVFGNLYTSGSIVKQLSKFDVKKKKKKKKMYMAQHRKRDLLSPILTEVQECLKDIINLLHAISFHDFQALSKTATNQHKFHR